MLLIKLNLILAILALISLVQASSKDDDVIHKDFPSRRLPTHVTPIHYELHLDTSRRNEDKVDGEVSIQLKINDFVGVNKSGRKKLRDFFSCIRNPDRDHEELENQCAQDNFAPNKIFIHLALGFVVLKDVAFYDDLSKYKRKKRKIKALEWDKKRQMIAIVFSKNLEPNSFGLLEFKFYGHLSCDLRGLYSVGYRDPGEERPTHTYLASLFQPSFARFVFPCFDEPRFKATFDFSITHGEDETALFNMPAQEDRSSKQLTRFQRTPPMSAHMLGFVVGRLRYVERQGVGRRGIPVRVYTLPGLEKGAQFALEVASRSLAWMEDYTGIDYPLPKFDIALVQDHEPDNTESWGMAVIRSNVSLFDSETTPATKITITVNVAHVVAHQWFANLITADWWNHLWITESVAAQKAFEILQDLYPEFQSEYFVRIATLSGVLQSDSKPGEALSPPDEQLVTAKNIWDLFSVWGVLVFMKSASLAQLIQNDLGPEKNKQVLRHLLKRHAYGTVDVNDLVEAFQVAAGKDASYIERFSSQIYQASYPILEVAEYSRPEWSLSIEQKEVKAQELGLTIQFGDASGVHETEMLPVKGSIEGKLQVPQWFHHENEDHWFKLNPNPDISSYYRVQYLGSLLGSNFKSAITKKYLSPLDRLNVLDDALSLVLLGKMLPSEFNQLVSYYENEDHGGVILGLLVASRALSSLNADDYRDSLASVGKVFLNAYKRFGFEAHEGQSFIESRAQMGSLTALVKFGDQQVVEEALKMFDEHSGLVPELQLREPIYAAVVAHGTSEQMELLFKHLDETNSQEEQVRLVKAIGVSANATIQRRLAKWQAERRYRPHCNLDIGAQIVLMFQNVK